MAAPTVREVHAFHEALRAHREPFIHQCLRDQPALARQPNALGESPLTTVVRAALRAPDRCVRGVIKALRLAGADIHAADPHGLQPIHWAALGTPTLVQTVLDAGANPNATHADGHTPLHLMLLMSPDNSACWEAIWTTLVAAGADITRPNAAGQTPSALYKAELNRWGKAWYAAQAQREAQQESPGSLSPATQAIVAASRRMTALATVPVSAPLPSVPSKTAV